ncbi:MAG: TetR/AcrR family transcriptional regulator [Cyanobacteria bacterium P01_A01_bin.123]
MQSKSKARERVLTAAQSLFVERGYEAVTVKDIAKAAGIHHASLYHHVPNGKSALYVEVMTRHMNHYREGLRSALNAAEMSLQENLQQVASWIISQPPLDVIRLANSDLPAIGTAEADILSDLAFVATILPILEVLETAKSRGEIEHDNLGPIAGALFSSLESLHAVPEAYLEKSRQSMADDIVEVFIKGMQP